MKKAPILYFFEGSINNVPDKYKARFPLKGTGRFEHGGKKRTGIFGTPYDDVHITPSGNSHSWRQIEKSLWIGVTKDFEPEDVARPFLHAGFKVTMKGKDWQIPVLNPFSENCSLPKCETITWNKETEKQEVVGEIVEEYAELTTEISEMVLEVESQFFTNEGNINLPYEDNEMRGLIARCIAINYDITEDELLALQVFVNDAYVGIIQSIIDWQGIVQVIKDKLISGGFFLNKENVTEDSSCGEET